MDESGFKVRGGVAPPKRVRMTSLPMGIAAGLGAAVIGGVAWAVIAIQLNVEIGWVAWLVGAFVGFMTVLGARSGGQTVGIAAALLAVVGLGIGKHITLEVGVKGEMRRQAREANIGVMFAAQKRLTESGVLQAEMMANMQGMDPGVLAAAAPSDELAESAAAMQARFQELLEQEAQHVTHAESEAAIDEFIDQGIAAVPIHKRYGLDGVLPILWIVLAVGSAFGVAKFRD